MTVSKIARPTKWKKLQMLKFIKQHKPELIIGAIFLFLGIIGSAIFFWLGLEKVDLYYEINSIPVISKNQKTFKPLNNKLKIDYAGNKVDNLTITEVRFFNKGKKGLKGEDISTNIPIKFKLDKKYKILDYVIDNNLTSKESNFILIPDNNEIKVTFNYMNTNNILTFRLLHTGFPSSEITFEGKGLGFKNIKNYKEQKIINSLFLLIPLYGIFGILGIFLGYFIFKFMLNHKKLKEKYLNKTVEAECRRQHIEYMQKIASDTLKKIKSTDK